MDKVDKINKFIIHGEWFENALIDLAAPENETLKRFQGALRLKRYRVADTDISYRTINHWEEMGLLFNEKDREEGWRKFNIVELVWLQIIRELRDYGMSIDAIKKVKEAVTFPDKKYPLLLLEIYISAFAKNKDAFLIVAKDGLSGLGISEEIEITQQFHPFPKSYITISINALFEKIQTGKDVVMKQSFLAPIDDDVNKILHAVMFENATEVKMTTRDRKINKIEIKKEHMNPEQAFQILRKLTKDGKRKRISLEVQNNKIIAIEEIEKTRRTEKQ